MKSTKKDTVTMSVKDAKASKKAGDTSERSYTFRTISVDKIFADNNVRDFEDIDDLVASIKAYGIINPITVSNNTGMASRYNIVAGFRRFAAAKKIGLTKVPCNVIDEKDGDNTREISVSENITRMDMTPYEECMAVKHLISKKNTVQKVASKFGRSLRWVLVRKKLADAGEKVMKKVMDGTIGLAKAAKLADLPDDVFKEALENCWKCDDGFIKDVLEKNHKDLSRAPFEHEACFKCDKCSSQQADLFEDEPKAYCLDPICWQLKVHDAAEKMVEDLKAEGKDARIGIISDYGGMSYEDPAYRYRIESYHQKKMEQVKEAGIQKRVLVCPDTCKTLEYYDERDLPGWHEESEEEREERFDKEREESFRDDVREDLYKSALRERIANVVKEGDKDEIIALLFFMVEDLDNTIDESQYDVLGIKMNEDNHYIDVNDIDDQVRPCDIPDAIKGSADHIMAHVYNEEWLEKMSWVICGKEPAGLKPTEREVDNEIQRRREEESKKETENKESEDEDSEETTENEEE